MFFRLIFSFSPDYPRWIVGAFFVAKMPQKCTETRRMHGEPAEMPDGEASGTGAEMRRERRQGTGAR